MKVKSLSKLIFQLKILKIIASEWFGFICTLGMFIIPTFVIWGADLFCCLFVIGCHYLLYIFKLKKIYQDILPEKHKIENTICILKSRRNQRTNIDSIRVIETFQNFHSSSVRKSSDQ